jgi:hypothetical protein
MIVGAPVNVLDYGADTNGVTDSSTAFTNALAASPSVTIPTGTYKLTTVVTTTSPVNLFGQNANATLSNGLKINTTSGYRGFLQNINFQTNTGTGKGLEVNDYHLAKFDTVTAKGFLNGAEFTYAWSNALLNCEFHFNSTGAVLQNNCNSFNVYSSSFTNNTNHGCTVQSSQKVSFWGCDFSNNTNYGLNISSTDNSTLQCVGVKVDSSYSEGNTTDFYVGSGANAVQVAACTFTNNSHFGAKSYGYVVDNAIGTKILFPDFTGATFSAAAILLTSKSQNTTIIPFVSAQIQSQVNATVSTETIQKGTVTVTLDGSGFGDATITFPIKYYQTPPVNLTLYSDSIPSGSLGTASIKNGIGVSSIYVQIYGGPVSGTVKIAWQAGA